MRRREFLYGVTALGLGGCCVLEPDVPLAAAGRPARVTRPRAERIPTEPLSDAGPSDAGPSDAGYDAGPSDAGYDAGPTDAGIDLPVPLATLFPLALQSGGVTTDSVILWTYAPTQTELEVWFFVDGQEAGDRVTVTGNDGYFHLELTGLAAHTQYDFIFVTGDENWRTVFGRFVTAPAPGDAPTVRVACATCTHPSRSPWPALSMMAQEEFDLLVHLGDFVYVDGADTQAAFQDEWRTSLSQAGYRALLPRAASYQTWDDHEFDNDINPETDSAIVDLGRAAFFEHTAQRRGTGDRLWRSYLWGDTVEFILMDCRTERVPSQGRYISDEQMAFVKDRLQNSPCRFKVLLNSVPLTNMPAVWDPFAGDRWEGYASQRDELLLFLEDDAAAAGVLLLSGDFHVGFIGHVERTGLHRRLLEIAVGPSGNSDNPFGLSFAREIALPDNQFDFSTNHLSSTVLTFHPDTGVVDVDWVRENGDVLFAGSVTPYQPA